MDEITDETPHEIAARPTARRARPRLVTLAAVLIAVSGALDILYAPIVVLAPFFDRPTPVLMEALGAVSIAAAIGIWRMWRWGRILGAGLCLVGLAQTLTVLVVAIADGEPLDVIPLALVSLAWTAALAGVPLWALVRRWPADF